MNGRCRCPNRCPVRGSACAESDREQWRTAVAGVLAKSSRKDPADLGAEPERLLDSPTYEGFPIRPLYTILDAQPEPPLPGRWPFVRGGDALRDVKSGWKVAESFPLPGETAASEGNGAVLHALSEGVSALVLRSVPTGCAAADLDRLLEGVFLELVPVILDAGADYAAAADAVLALVARLRRRPARAAVGRPRRRPVDGATVGQGRAASRRRVAVAAKLGGYGRRRAGGHRRRARLPRPRRQRVVGARRCGRGGVDYLRLLAERGVASGMRCSRSASGSPPTTTSS